MSLSFDLPLRHHFQPASAPDRPLMIIMHGLGDRMESFYDLPGALLGKEINYLFLNAPDSYIIGWKWYDLDGQQGPGLEKSRKLLEETLNSLQSSQLSINRSQVILSGFSQGAVVSLYTGLRAEEPVGAIVALSGYLFGEPSEWNNAAIHTPIFMCHGIHDELLPVETSRQHARNLEGAGYPLTWKEYAMPHSICREELDDVSSFLRNTFSL